jgi:hypothetical protein
VLNKRSETTTTRSIQQRYECICELEAVKWQVSWGVEPVTPPPANSAANLQFRWEPVNLAKHALWYDETPTAGTLLHRHCIQRETLQSRPSLLFSPSENVIEINFKNLPIRGISQMKEMHEKRDFSSRTPRKHLSVDTE